MFQHFYLGSYLVNVSVMYSKNFCCYQRSAWVQINWHGFSSWVVLVLAEVPVALVIDEASLYGPFDILVSIGSSEVSFECHVMSSEDAIVCFT
jgi:hypothetical protein